MLKKKSALQTMQSKKSVKSGKAKSTKKVTAKTMDYLAPLHAVTKCIENDYSQLKKLFETIPHKIEKSLATTKTKLQKAKDTKIKSEKLLAETKKKQKAKPEAKHKQDLIKQEKALSAAKTSIADLDPEL